MPRTQPLKSIVKLLLLALFVAASPCARAAADWTTTKEYWYAMELEGSPVGWMHNLEERSEDDAIRSTSRTKLSIQRAGASMSAMITSVFIETAAGKPVKFEFTQDMSAQALHSTCTFDDDGLTLVSRQGDQETRQTLPPIEGEWLTPRAASERFTQGVKRGEDVIEYRMIDPASGPEPIEVRHERIGEDTVDVAGVDTPVTVWKTSTSTMPAAFAATERYDAEGVLVSQDLSMGIGKLIARRCSKAEAMREATGPPPELLVSSTIKPDKPLKRVESVTHLELRLRVNDGEMPDLPSAGAQRVAMQDDGSAIVTIDLDREGDEWAEEKPEDMSEFLEPSMLINAEDEEIIALSKKAVRGAKDDAMSKAEALRAFVERYITRKGLEVAFATAGETARSRQGDCSEHAVLLCALLRAQQIPARIATGLVYVDEFAGERDIFGWHMWTQAWIDDHWVDFDATLRRRFHAGHIMTGASSLAAGIGDVDLMSLLMLIGKLDIDVLDVEYAAPREPARTSP